MATVFVCACERRRERALEINYVSAPRAILRDQLAQLYHKVGVLRNGERVEVLDRERHFAKVRLENGQVGWVEQRFLVNEKVFDAFESMAREEQGAPVVGTASTRRDTNLHVQPGRDTEHLYQLAEGARVSILRRQTAEKNLPGLPPLVPEGGGKIVKPVEDWWLVRDSRNHVGWVLGRMIDLDVPPDIAQYAEGQRIVAWFVLNEVADGDKRVPQYLMLLTGPKDGLPFDFNQARVFTWNVKRRRYETAYREHNLNGVLPASVSHEVFGEQGDLPTFTLRVSDKSGNVVERRYKFNAPVVRKVNLE